MGDPYRQPAEEQAYPVQHFWERVVHDGPMGLTRQHWRTIDRDMSEYGRAVLKHFVESVERQAKWVVEARAAIESEAQRIATVGKMMRIAGLHSYVDKEGRVYTATPEPSKANLPSDSERTEDK